MIIKNKKSLFLNFLLLFVLFCLTAVSCILADNASSGRQLFFGPPILGLEGTGLVASKSKEGALPLIKSSLAGGKTETLHFSVDTNKISLKAIKGKDYIGIDGLKPYGNPGQPQVPFQSFVITLPADSEVLGVSVGEVAYRPIFNKLDIVSAPMPVASTQNVKQIDNTEKQIKTQNDKPTTNTNKSYNKCKNCNSEAFFPGNLVSYYTGTGNNNRYVFIKFFPMQYIPNSGRAILVTDADITVNYQLTNTEQK